MTLHSAESFSFVIWRDCFSVRKAENELFFLNSDENCLWGRGVKLGFPQKMEKVFYRGGGLKCVVTGCFVCTHLHMKTLHICNTYIYMYLFTLITQTFPVFETHSLLCKKHFGVLEPNKLLKKIVIDFFFSFFLPLYHLFI